MSENINIKRILTVADALGNLASTVVFVGGATLSFYAERPTLEIRPTKDIDILIELLTYHDYAQLEKEIRPLGFRNDVESGVICRYKLDEVIVDIMPTSGNILGFANKWYATGFKNALAYEITQTRKIKILSAPYFVAAKFEAFKSRGRYNGRTSHDFEDIVYVLENRTSFWDEIKQSSDEIKEYFKVEFGNLLAHKSFTEWLDCNVERNSPPATNLIIEKMREFLR
ncbi:hypothetical protein BH09BAC1_BH09BAC1_04450 [soil metagenome]